jgi:hypothetical protein
MPASHYYLDAAGVSGDDYNLTSTRILSARLGFRKACCRSAQPAPVFIDTPPASGSESGR